MCISFLFRVGCHEIWMYISFLFRVGCHETLRYISYSIPFHSFPPPLRALLGKFIIIIFFWGINEKMNYPCLSTTAMISPVLKINKIKIWSHNFCYKIDPKHFGFPDSNKQVYTDPRTRIRIQMAKYQPKPATPNLNC